MSMLTLYYNGSGCGTWSEVRVDRSLGAFKKKMNRVTTSMDCYGSVYPCPAGSGGIFIVRCVSACAEGGRGCSTCIEPFPVLPLVPSQCEYLFSASSLPPSWHAESGYVY